MHGGGGPCNLIKEADKRLENGAFVTAKRNAIAGVRSRRALEALLLGASEVAFSVASAAVGLLSSAAAEAASFGGGADAEALPRFKPALRKGNTRRP